MPEITLASSADGHVSQPLAIDRVVHANAADLHGIALPEGRN